MRLRPRRRSASCARDRTRTPARDARARGSRRCRGGASPHLRSAILTLPAPRHRCDDAPVRRRTRRAIVPTPRHRALPHPARSLRSDAPAPRSRHDLRLPVGLLDPRAGQGRPGEAALLEPARRLLAVPGRDRRLGDDVVGPEAVEARPEGEASARRQRLHLAGHGARQELHDHQGARARHDPHSRRDHRGDQLRGDPGPRGHGDSAGAPDRHAGRLGRRHLADRRRGAGGARGHRFADRRGAGRRRRSPRRAAQHPGRLQQVVRRRGRLVVLGRADPHGARRRRRRARPVEKKSTAATARRRARAGSSARDRGARGRSRATSRRAARPQRRCGSPGARRSGRRARWSCTRTRRRGPRRRAAPRSDEPPTPSPRKRVSA